MGDCAGGDLHINRIRQLVIHLERPFVPGGGRELSVGDRDEVEVRLDGSSQPA